jgi:hypothetical protein
MKQWIITLSACAVLALPMGGAAYAHDAGDAALDGLVGGIVGGLISSGAAPVYVAPAPEPIVIERYEPAPVVIERYGPPPIYYREGYRHWHDHDGYEHRWHRWHRHHRDWDDD